MKRDELSGVFEFGPYRLDVDRRTLTKQRRPIELNPKCFAALAYLVERAGAVVTKDELLAAVWPEGCVEPNNVPQTIYMLRRTLKIAGDHDEFIATVPGRGYRFVPETHDAAPFESAPAVEAAPARHPMSVPMRATAIGAILALSIIALLSTVRPPKTPTPQVDTSAKVAYEQGRFYWSRRTDVSIKIALNHFESAVRLDPQYAQAYSGLADTYSVMRMTSTSVTDAKRLAKLARDAALKSLSIDSGCAECHTSMAFVAENIDHDFKTAGREFREAIRLDPSYATAHEWYSWYLFYQHKQVTDALAEMQRASELEPNSPIIKIALGWQLFYTRQFDRAGNAFVDASMLDPKNDFAWFGVALAQEQSGQLDEALKAIEEANRLNPEAGYVAERARILAEQHRRHDAEASLARLLAQHPRPWYYLALVYDALDQHQLAQRYLALAHKNHDDTVMFVPYDPRIDDLRSTAYPAY